jgi:spore germination cell wall hydrolase CwlJ-like protein
MAKIAVAYVVLNRKKSGRWGDDIKTVVTQPGQFEPSDPGRSGCFLLGVAS